MILSAISAAARARGVLLDSNLFLVYLVGLWDPQQISRFSKTAEYQPEDFHLLELVLVRNGALVVTPALLTEVCNLCGNLNTRHNRVIYRLLAEVVALAEESRKSSKLICALNEFTTIGYADASALDCSKRGILVITDDFECLQYIHRAGGLGLNMNHLRSESWL